MKKQLFSSFILSSFALLMWPLAPTAPYTADNIMAGINIKRAEYSRSELRYNTQLEYAAYLKASDMWERGYFAHHLKGEDTWQFLKQTDYDWWIAGEDLAIAYDSPGAVIEAWMKSPGHRKILLTRGYEDIGVAVICKQFKKQICIVVAEFGTINKLRIKK